MLNWRKRNEILKKSTALEGTEISIICLMLSVFCVCFACLLVFVLACRADQVPCSDGSCVDRTYLCDGYQDCLDGADEKNCKLHCLPL